jgi:uncharacterized membrane protein
MAGAHAAVLASLHPPKDTLKLFEFIGRDYRSLLITATFQLDLVPTMLLQSRTWKSHTKSLILLELTFIELEAAVVVKTKKKTNVGL